jgi:hypothetical protein
LNDFPSQNKDKRRKEEEEEEERKGEEYKRSNCK